MKIALLLIGFGFGLLWGWAAAHYTVAAECERLGGFFVGDRIYKCHAIGDRTKELEQ